ncbi:DNA mismatch repair protein msh6 [Sorochytrium milnesiophthora]
MSQSQPRSQRSSSSATPSKSQQQTLFAFFGKPKTPSAASSAAKPAPPTAAANALPSPPIPNLSVAPRDAASNSGPLAAKRQILHVQPRPAAATATPSSLSITRDVPMRDATSEDAPSSDTQTPGGSLRKRFRGIVVSDEDEKDAFEGENTPSKPAIINNKSAPASTSTSTRKRPRAVASTIKPKPAAVAVSDDEDDGDFVPDRDEHEEPESEEEDYGNASDEQDLPPSPTKQPKSSTARLQKFKMAAASAPGSKRAASTVFLSSEERRKDRNAKFQEANKDTYRWLEDIKDADGRRPADPDYNPRTLYIPSNAWSSFTNFERQFWEIKCNYFDTVVFFKKGKFYELYERDADIGHQEFDLRLSNGGRAAMRMVGVPEFSFEEWASKFIAKGYKVARVDQMETATGKAMREKAGGATDKVEKIIRRELTAVLTAGTLVDGGLITSDMSAFCMCIKELCLNEGLPPRFAVCFVDTSTAEFHFSLFDDDLSRTKLETILVQVRPRELVTERNGLSAKTQKLIKAVLLRPIWNVLVPGQEFWDYQRTVDELDVSKYFSAQDGSRGSWPAVLQQRRGDELLISCFGGLIKLDQSLLTLQNFHWFDPLHQTSSLLLDGQTLTNLGVFVNDAGTEEGTLMALLNCCVTPFGKRLFRRWLCHPLRAQRDIEERLDAVDSLMQSGELHELITSTLRKCPDIERIVSRIHMGTCRIKEMVQVLKGLQRGSELIAALRQRSDNIQSTRLQHLIGNFPHLDELLSFFARAFDHGQALEQGNIIPRAGVDEEYDSVLQKIDEMQAGYDAHLKQVQQHLGTRQVKYKHLGKEPNQLEVSSSVAVPNDWKKMSGTKAVSRYHTPRITRMNEKWAELQEMRTLILSESTKRMYRRFDQHYAVWSAAVTVLAELDALASLASSSQAMGQPVCRPEFVPPVQDQAVLELEEMRHPCMALRHVSCIAVILAQLGCYVPARRCRMSIFDRIFTRIGANDNILAGQSTFMVELSETSKILREATPRSMVILDELGRGTSTFDGYAIAFAVLHDLVSRVGCVGLFSTHYGMLTQEFGETVAPSGRVANWHMGCLVDELVSRQVTFLYKLTPGACPKSYGMNVANMAGLDHQIVERAEQVAHEFEETRQLRDLNQRKGQQAQKQGPNALLRQGDFRLLMMTQDAGTASVARRLHQVLGRE